MTHTEDSRELTIIRPGGLPLGVSLAELVHAKRLLAFLVWRDLRVRYKETWLGGLWALGQPLLSVLMLTLVFSELGRVRTGSVSYPLFSLVGIVPFALFSAVATRAAGSLLSEGYLMSRVYFPRLVLPLAAAGVPIVDALIGLAVALAAMLVLDQPTPATFPLAIICLLLIALLGEVVGILLAAFIVWVRDVRNVLPLLLQVWLFATPVAYPPEALPSHLAWLLTFNPLAWPVLSFRALALGGTLNTDGLLASALFLAVLGPLGLVGFHRAAQRVVDVF